MRNLPLVLIPICLCACAQGGVEDRPRSEVQIASSHHMFGLRAQPRFSNFPVPAAEVLPDRGLLHTRNDSTYTVTRTTGTSGADGYALAKNGSLKIFLTGAPRTPTVVFPGAYGLSGDRGDFFFIDQSSTTSSPSLGMFCGTRLITGTTELAGNWHLLSLHVLFPASAVGSPHNVARGTWGSITIPDDPGGDPGTLRTITEGTGMDSSNLAVDFADSEIQYLVQGATGDGSCNLTMKYKIGTATPDPRVFQKAAVGKGALFAVDADRTDGEAGLLFLVEEFEATTPDGIATAANLAGEFLVGALTLFVNPLDSRSGTDGAVGRLSFTAQGAFRFDMVGSRNIDFTYTGTYTIADNGKLTLTVPGTSEVWHGAVSTDYHAVFVLDGFVETRANNTPELNLFMGLREKPQAPPATPDGSR